MSLTWLVKTRGWLARARYMVTRAVSLGIVALLLSGIAATVRGFVRPSREMGIARRAVTS